MRVVPKTVNGKISFYNTRIPKWAVDSTKIGSTAEEIAALSDKPFREPWRKGFTFSSGILANPTIARIFFTCVDVVRCFSFRLETLPPRG